MLSRTFSFQITTKEGCLNSWWMVMCKTKNKVQRLENRVKT